MNLAQAKSLYPTQSWHIYKPIDFAVKREDTNGNPLYPNHQGQVSIEMVYLGNQELLQKLTVEIPFDQLLKLQSEINCALGIDSETTPDIPEDDRASVERERYYGILYRLIESGNTIPEDLAGKALEIYRAAETAIS